MDTYTVDFKKLIPVNYNRKSSESEDMQMLSIDSQFDEAKRISEFYKLTPFVMVFKESKSAKTKGVRPEFTKMMKMIEKGEIDSIVCWKADRLARNMEEGGKIIDLLSSGTIKAIIAHDKVFYPWDNVMILAIEFGMGKQYVKELSVNVKRGQKKKAVNGLPHGVASLGFINDKTGEKGNRKWLVDKPRLKKISILLDMFLTGTYSAGKLYKHATEELKLLTVNRKRSGGNLIALSRIYEILKDPIYAGFFFYGGEKYTLDESLPRLITEEQHNKIKIILSNKNVPKFQCHETLYSGILLSDEGDFMGQDVKYQLICDCKAKFAYRSRTHCPNCNKEISKLEHPKYLDFTYYYNVRKKKKDIEYKYISSDVITNKLLTFINGNLNFSQELAEWSKRYITELKDKEINETIFKKEQEEADRSEYELKKSRLRVMLRDEKITDEEYKSDLETLNKRYAISDKKSDIDWYSKMNKIVDLTSCLMKTLENGAIKAKRILLSELGSNLVWNDKELSINNGIAINKLVEGIKLAKAETPEFEPKNFLAIQHSKEKTGMFLPVFSTLLALADDFITIDWAKEYPYPTISLGEIKNLLCN